MIYFLFDLINFHISDGNVSVQKKFVRKEFNFGLQERLTGTDLPVEENDFKMCVICNVRKKR